MKPDVVATFRGARPGRVWWRSVYIPLEVKRPENPDPAALQLLRYVRQALREQPDCRFMYGLVFSKVNLTVWHVDRSGSLASTSINVHEDPKKFIHVILGFLIMEPVDIGWDPSMKMCFEDEDGNLSEPMESYLIDQNDRPDTERSAFKTQWVVTMDRMITSEGELETVQFVLCRALSLARGEVIRVRATRVWRAWKMSDMLKPRQQRAIYVYEDTWRDERRGLEGDLYLKLQGHPGQRGVASMYCYGVVRIKTRVDDTLGLIRQSLQHNGRPLDLGSRQRRQGTSFDIMDSEEINSLPMTSGSLPETGAVYEWAHDFFYKEATEHVPRNRIHSRLIMSSTGWRLLEFVSLQELSEGMQDAIAGHRWLYEQGLLHRDISFNNILLTGRPAPNRAILIDLDHAIEYKNYQSIPDDERSVQGTLAFMSFEVITGNQYDFDQDDLDADSDDGDSDFDDHDSPDEGEQLEPTPIGHDFIHDLESFFWVLVWISMSREGPGARRTTWPIGPKANLAVRLMLSQSFEIRDVMSIADRKNAVITYGARLFKDQVIRAFAPYFEGPMATVIQRLHRYLRQAYSRRRKISTAVYDQFDRVLMKVERHSRTKNWNATNPAFMKMASDIEKRREEDVLIWESPDPVRFRELGAKKRRISDRDEDGSVLAEEDDDPDSRASSPSPKKTTGEDMVLKTSQL
ncbi:hypothetical protein BV25DRAFT_1832431 [Artomyces pyxidatus]|uniref:Uncharacterized protein n=1 Tax=Artomyces pyxidatus TaxID=48021 RepID=A0ACB8SIY2_9AGAM|nr:hypothetical protein BV25DRAFT_1832431 [Artomyces pyxidatus]